MTVAGVIMPDEAAGGATTTRDRMTDADLVAAVRAGDRSAFDLLYRHHRRTVEAVVAAHVHGAEAAADAVQETFARALDRIATLRDPSRFRPWLAAIARNAAVDQHRCVLASWSSTDAAAADLVGTEASLAEIAETHEQQGVLAEAISELPARDAAVLGLVGHLGFKPEEVGVAMGMSSNAARVALHRARNRARCHLSSDVAQPRCRCLSGLPSHSRSRPPSRG